MVEPSESKEKSQKQQNSDLLTPCFQQPFSTFNQNSNLFKNSQEEKENQENPFMKGVVEHSDLSEDQAIN